MTKPNARIGTATLLVLCTMVALSGCGGGGTATPDSGASGGGTSGGSGGGGTEVVVGVPMPNSVAVVTATNAN